MQILKNVEANNSEMKKYVYRLSFFYSLKYYIYHLFPSSTLLRPLPPPCICISLGKILRCRLAESKVLHISRFDGWFHPLL